MKGIRVRCSNGKLYTSIRDAANAAGVNEWTMSYKMVSAGGFIDKDGNEYTRVDPANFKNNYPDTGKTAKHRGFHKRKVEEHQEKLYLPDIDGSPRKQPDYPEPIVRLVVDEPLDFEINGGSDNFTMTIKGLSAKRLAKVIVTLTKDE